MAHHHEGDVQRAPRPTRTSELIRKLRLWAEHRDKLNENRTDKAPLDSQLLRRAATRLEELSGLDESNPEKKKGREQGRER